jgi:hypothetical protein
MNEVEGVGAAEIREIADGTLAHTISRGSQDATTCAMQIRIRSARPSGQRGRSLPCSKTTAAKESGGGYFLGRGFYYRPSSAARPPKKHGPASRRPRPSAESAPLSQPRFCLSTRLPRLYRQLSRLYRQLSRLSRQLSRLSRQLSRRSRQLPGLPRQLSRLSRQLSRLSRQLLGVTYRGGSARHCSEMVHCVV